MTLSYFRYILDKPSLAKILGHEEPVEYGPKKSNDASIKPMETQSHLTTTHGQFLLVDSTVVDQIGFTVLPNHEICIAGIKLVGQLMPKHPSDPTKYLLSLWEWIAPVLKSCTQASNEIRYNIAPVT